MIKSEAHEGSRPKCPHFWYISPSGKITVSPSTGSNRLFAVIVHKLFWPPVHHVVWSVMATHTVSSAKHDVTWL